MPWLRYVETVLLYCVMTNHMEVNFNLVLGPTGSVMRITGDRGAASCHVNINGVFSHRVWIIQANFKCQSKKPVESMLHLPGASLP